MKQTTDVIIIGGGVVGASAAFAFAKQGQRVLLVEQNAPASSGATGTSGGLLRRFHLDPVLTQLAHRSLPVFQQWQELIGGDCGYQQTGFVTLVNRQEQEQVENVMERYRSENLPLQLWSGETFRQHQPHWQGTDVACAVWEPDGGYAEPRLAVSAWLDGAKQRGAVVMNGVVATRLHVRQGSVFAVDTSAGTWEAKRVVVANNAWARTLLEPLGLQVPLRTKRIMLQRIRWQETEAEFHPACIDSCLDTYFRSDGTGYTLAGSSCDHWYLRPEDVPTYVDQAYQERVMERVSMRLNRQSPVGEGGRSGFDAYTPDGRPLLGEWGYEGLSVALGFSGGGFKCAPVVGDLLSDNRSTVGIDTAPFAPDRFSR